MSATRKMNTILPDWMQNVFDIVGDIGLIITFLRWAYRHRTKLSNVYPFVGVGVMLTLAWFFPIAQTPYRPDRWIER